MRILFILLFASFSLSVFASADFNVIQLNAKLSSLAYLPQSQVSEELDNMGHALQRYNELPVTQVSYFLSEIKGKQFLVVRGTSNLENVLLDLDIQLKADVRTGIQLHQGFAAAARAIYLDAKPLLSKSKPIYTTGHSLGGAVALILAMYLEKDAYNLQGSTTFGQPKVTNVLGARQFSQLKVSRIVTPLDMVPLVPALSPLELQNLDIYWHVGEEIILMPANQYAVTSGIKSMLRASKFIDKAPDETNFHAHQMTTYLNLIESKLINAQQVPYKTGINLFGFSLD